MAPRIRLMSEIKNQLMRPATTSHFECSFTAPSKVVEFMGKRADAGAGVQLNSQIMDRINISCHDASLPGSSLQTATLTDSYTGVTENYAYRRAYDNRADFTFYVDYLENQSSGTQAYSVILFFENWISYIAGEQFTEGLEGFNYFYKMQFPENYIANKILITKFEKDYGKTGKFLEYSFINAFPISIASMPVSYDFSQVLKCTVSFSYQRYTVKISRGSNPISPATPTNVNSPGVPENRAINPNLSSPVINDVNGNTFPLGPGVPGLTGISNPTVA
jgi:hypothetical protein